MIEGNARHRTKWKPRQRNQGRLPEKGSASVELKE